MYVYTYMYYFFMYHNNFSLQDIHILHFWFKNTHYHKRERERKKRELRRKRGEQSFAKDYIFFFFLCRRGGVPSFASGWDSNLFPTLLEFLFFLYFFLVFFCSEHFRIIAVFVSLSFSRSLSEKKKNFLYNNKNTGVYISWIKKGSFFSSFFV